MINKDTFIKMKFGIIAIILLSICLCVTTFAVVWAIVSVDNNQFQTGRVKLNLNDDKPVISEYENQFEPGMRIKKEFFLENLSTCSVYYRLYFSDIDGGLADIIEITITYGDTILYNGKINDLTKDKVGVTDDVFKIGERRTFSILFYYPEDSGNETKGKHLTFTLCADAVQEKNNPDKLF